MIKNTFYVQYIHKNKIQEFSFKAYTKILMKCIWLYAEILELFGKNNIIWIGMNSKLKI